MGSCGSNSSAYHQTNPNLSSLKEQRRRTSYSKCRIPLNHNEITVSQINTEPLSAINTNHNPSASILSISPMSESMDNDDESIEKMYDNITPNNVTSIGSLSGIDYVEEIIKFRANYGDIDIGINIATDDNPAFIQLSIPPIPITDDDTANNIKHDHDIKGYTKSNASNASNQEIIPLNDTLSPKNTSNGTKKQQISHDYSNDDDDHKTKVIGDEDKEITTPNGTKKQRPNLIKPDTKTPWNNSDVDDLENDMKQQLNNLDTKMFPDGFNVNKLNNPYLDPLLMKGLRRFSPQQNEQYIRSYSTNIYQDKSSDDDECVDDESDNDDDNDKLNEMRLKEIDDNVEIYTSKTKLQLD